LLEAGDGRLMVSEGGEQVPPQLVDPGVDEPWAQVKVCLVGRQGVLVTLELGVGLSQHVLGAASRDRVGCKGGLAKVDQGGTDFALVEISLPEPQLSLGGDLGVTAAGYGILEDFHGS
jgi:hypothetical protein